MSSSLSFYIWNSNSEKWVKLSNTFLILCFLTASRAVCYQNALCENLQKELLGRRREAKRLKKIILKNNNSYILKQQTVFKACSDWLLKLPISIDIHFRATPKGLTPKNIVIVVAIYDIKLSFWAMLFHRFIISKTTMYFSVGGGRYSPHRFAAR